MPEHGRCSSCGGKLSPARLRTFLRRRALARLVYAEVWGGPRAPSSVTHAALARLLTAAGFATTKNTVTKDLREVRRLEASYREVRRRTHPEEES